ncbi:hypothetical protein BRADI_3g40190v3 [Brachypodium distachyon]|uniref:PsbP C-terminal domain-containing protein n=2 Tax=Brachypodium distachyon TaxID=15368 RepID=I1I8I7_BRADI|nr:hypothetical protein BRADI_3g40190v3 [Brachypodium distachyon]
MAAVTTASSAICPGFSSNPRRGHAKPRRSTAWACHCRRSPALREQQPTAAVAGTAEEGLRRRDALLGVVFSAGTATLLASPAGALAEAAAEVQEGFSEYQDEANKFSIVVPQGWQMGAGEGSGFKNVTAFFPDKAADSSVSVVITGIGPDFTSLKSFGDVDAFAENLVTGLDRSWQRPAGVTAKLIDSRASNGMYYIEYTLQNPGDKRRHIVSAIGMAFNGWYNRLYTVTGQYIEDDEESVKFKPQIEKSVKSFKFT